MNSCEAIGSMQLLAHEGQRVVARAISGVAFKTCPAVGWHPTSSTEAKREYESVRIAVEKA